jgi:multidrug resistance efflux pump
MPSKKHAILPAIILLAIVVGSFYGYRRMRAAAPPLPTAQVVQGDLDMVVKTRGEIMALRSVTLSAPPRVQTVQIVSMVPSGTVVSAGDAVIEIDATSEIDRLALQESNMKQIDARIERLRAQQRMADESDRVQLAQYEFNVESAKLDVKKADVISEIDAAKNRLKLANAERDLAEWKQDMALKDKQQEYEVNQILQDRKSRERDYKLAQDNIQNLLIKTPISGIFQALPNRRQGAMRMGGGGGPGAGGPGGRGGGSAPEFRPGDQAFAGANIGEIPDLTSLAVTVSVDETDRGKIAVGQPVRIKVDAFPDSLINGKIDSITPLTQIDRSTVPPSRRFWATVSMDLEHAKLGAKEVPKQAAAAPQETPGAAGTDQASGGRAERGQGGFGGENGASAGGAGGSGRRNAAGAALGGAAGEGQAARTARGGQGGQGGGGSGRQGGEGTAQGGSGQGQGGFGGRQGGGDTAALEQMRQRFANMSPEERAAAMQQLRGGGGGRGGQGGQDAAGRGAPRPQIVVPHLEFTPKQTEERAAGDIGLRPGMSTGAEIITNTLKKVVLIPVRASFDKQGKVIAYVKQGNKFEPREITLGYRSEALVQVVSGLKPGEAVALEEPPEAKGGK